MQDKQKISLLRLCFWIGAIIDAVAAIQLLLPDFWASSYGFETHMPGPELNAALWSATALMAGWTVLLLWADRKPVERKEIMLITLFPVLAGLTLNNVYGVVSGVMDVRATLPIIALQLAAGSLYVISYYITRDVRVGLSGLSRKSAA
jgi:hypothetical protein